MSKPERVDETAAITQEYARLLSLAAHEFRTPASVVGGYLRMLQKDADPLTERQRKMIGEAARSCARMVALVAELSEIGKLDAATAQVKDEAFDLFSDLEEVARNVHEGEDRDVRLRLSGPSVGAPLTGDRQRVTNAFGAFFRALLREQPTAATVLGDRRLMKTGNSTSAVIVIAKESDVQRAYDAVAQPFDEYRGGVGLSLPIARRALERAGGRVWAPTPADADDRGLRSAVIVSIPLPE